MPFAEIALPLPLRQTFLYRVPERLDGDVRPGVQVQVPFRGTTKRGFVIARAIESVRDEVKELIGLTGAPPISPHMLSLALWIADYYLAPLGEVLAATLPGGLEGFAKSRGRRAATEDPVVPMPLPERFTLTAEQRSAIATIEGALARRGFAPFLLHGVTASGKTEVYLRAAAVAREAGGQTLVLVPEVALGSQLVRDFRRRFGARVGVLHSYLSVGERRRNWELASRGALDVVVGARSAVFAPLPKLALIVVDEEHEPAYKQSTQLRYHARDVAVRRAQMLGIPVVLGSATPALESHANVARGKYELLALPRRVDRRALPEVRIVDLRREAASGALLSRPLRDAIAQRLERGEQTMLFLNRRGHSHYTQCRACGWVPECPHCDIALTLHVAPRAWRCHYCDHAEPAGDTCRKCGAQLLRFGGAGTQRAEREMVAAFPGARILRLDTDVARERGRVSEILAAFGRGDADILLGTQMIAKGFDFPRVTLVGVLDADVALHLPDFRAAERAWQLLTQVAGRAGRGSAPGEVLIQTCTPDHPAIAAAVLGDERGFLEREGKEREEAGYPPALRIAALLFSGKEEAQVEESATCVADALRADLALADVAVLGPAPQMLARMRGQHRWHILLKAARPGVLRAAATRALEVAEQTKRPRAVRVVADIDPYEVL
jgi:primosomal protein N' (replication factor Y)